MSSLHGTSRAFTIAPCEPRVASSARIKVTHPGTYARSVFRLYDYLTYPKPFFMLRYIYLGFTDACLALFCLVSSEVRIVICCFRGSLLVT